MDYLIEFDYDADEVDELTIRKGDIVNKVKAYEDGWLFGVLRGKEGVFPSNFGNPLKDEKKKVSDEEVSENIESSKKVSVEDDESNDHSRPAKKVTGVGYGNIFSGGKIQLKQTSNNRDITKTPIDETKPEILAETKPINKSKPEMARVIHSYKAENFDELNLEEGDLITIIDKDNEDDGWWKGKLSNGQIGVFPDNFVELVKAPLEEKPPSRPQQNTTLPKAPPPVTALKPKSVPPRPPGLQAGAPVNGNLKTPQTVTNSVPEQKSAPSKVQNRISSQEKEDGISFDTVQPHKLLVGPNADRAKNRGKKPPSSVTIVRSDNCEDKPVVEEERKTVSQYAKALSKEPSPAHPEKLPELTSQKSKQWSGTSTSVDPVPDPLLSTKSKSARDSWVNSGAGTSTDRSPDVTSKLKSTKDASFDKPALETTGTSEPKSTTSSKFTGLSRKVEVADSSSKEDSITGLQKKVNQLQEENQDLRKELAELRKSTGDQINWLKTKLNKLITELDDEKVKRASNEVNFNRLKTSVETLEGTLLSRAHE